jgi:molybdenum cofactor cytidylyltransferase
MKLVDALPTGPGDIVAFVGAGGKTTAMFRLAHELAGQGYRVISTTTTRLAEHEIASAPDRIPISDAAGVRSLLASRLARHRHVFVYSRIENGKALGVPPSWLAEHARHALADVILVEADGARGLPMKVPYPHEPVIPAMATVVVPVAGLDALGQPPDSRTIYGADLLRGRPDIPPHTAITPALVAAVLAGSDMGMKGVPPGARVIPLLNKTSGGTIAPAREIAARILDTSPAERVLIGAVQDDEPIREVRRRVSAVILAAGSARRMGQPKLLLPGQDGQPIIRRVCQQVSSCDVSEVLVITGAWHAAIAGAVGDLPVRLILNPDHAAGEMITSLQVGLRAARADSAACLVVLGDMPAIQRMVIERVLTAYAEGSGDIVIPGYEGRRGHPTLFDRSLWPQLLALPPGAAPRDVVRANAGRVCDLAVETDTILLDIDTPEDYQSFLGRDSDYNKG